MGGDAGRWLALGVGIEGDVATIRLRRPQRANALNEATITELGEFFAEPPAGVRAAVLLAEGEHFCAGLDLAEHRSRSPFESMEHSRRWHATFDRLEHGRVPVVAALQGAVIGGGLELALAAHVRVAGPSAFYSLPEGRLGIFVGGGGAVRIGRLLGTDRMREMMLTGRRVTAAQGQRLGISHEMVHTGEVGARAHDVARRIAANAPLTNQLILAALPRVSDMSRGDGLWAEALTTALTQSTADAQEGLQAFLKKRPPVFRGT